VSSEPSDAAQEVVSQLKEQWERKILLDFLRAETNRINSASQRPGWTLWALWAALAALVSHALITVEKGDHTWSHIGTLLVLLCVVADITRISTRIIEGSRDSDRVEGRFTLLSESICPFRLSICASLVRVIALWIVFSHSDFGLERLFSLSLRAFLFLSAFGALSGLLCSVLHTPLLKTPKSKWWVGPLTFFLWAGLGGFACYGIIRRLLLLTPPPTVADWQLGIFLAAIAYMLIQLSRIRHTPPLLSDLIHVERRLALGSISVAEAREKTDRILHGLTLGDVLQPQILRALRDLEAVEDECEKYKVEVGALQTVLSKCTGALEEKQTEPALREEAATVEALFCALDARVASRSACVKQAHKSLLTLQKRARLIESSSPDMATDIESLSSGVQAGIERVNESLQQIDVALAKLSETVAHAAKPATVASGSSE
jgi:hypothetical protein